MMTEHEEARRLDAMLADVLEAGRALEEQRNEAVRELERLQETCPICGHLWRQHDPEDGMCDSHTSEPGKFGACECGRNIGWMQTTIAGLSHAALSADTQREEG
jgi:hypothetical protein